MDDQNVLECWQVEIMRGKMENISNGGALAVPAGVDPDWQDKIARAKEARDAALQRREGKPVIFSSGWTICNSKNQ